MNTTQLECFLTAANFLNFSRAAEHLQLTQPAVSHQIRTLEDELGVSLFNRAGRKVSLTQEGHLFVQYAGEILKLAGMSRSRLLESAQIRPVRLGIACRNTMELALLRPALSQLREEQPELLPAIRIVPFDSIENQLREGQVQVMFSYQEIAPKNGEYRELLRCPLVAVCLPDHPLALQASPTLPQLSEAGRIAVCRPPICPPTLFALQGRIATLKAPGQTIFCESWEAIHTLVETGFAFTVETDLPQARRPDLRYLPLDGFEPLSFGVVTLPGGRDPMVRRLLALLQQTLS